MAETSVREFVGSDRMLLAIVLLAGVAGSGIARWAFGQAGFDTIGQIAFVLGYGGMVVVVWYGWIRPLDIRGPDKSNRPERVDSNRLDDPDSEPDSHLDP
ncbi:MAG: hypothetical protein ACQETB_07485 [Halobacteriota archaeon]